MMMLKWLGGLVLLLAVAGLAFGYAARWELVGTLNILDKFSSGPAGVRVAEAIAYGDTPSQRVDVYAPGGDTTDDRKPVIIWFHGGGWNNGGRRQYAFAGRALAAEDFVSVVAGYRLDEEGKFPVFMEDAAAAIRWTHANIARYGGDPERIVLAGHSAGGHIVALAALDESWLGDLARPGGAIRGVVGIAGAYDWLPFTPGSSSDKYLGHTRPLSRTQPVTYARADAPPMLLLWGDADTLVYRRNIDGLCAALVAQQGVVSTKIYPGVDHSEIVMGLSRPYRDVAPTLADTLAFAREVTSGGLPALRSGEAEAATEAP
jgi:acetyl esterase/lipase